MIDREKLLAETDLLAVVEHDLGVRGRRSGRCRGGGHWWMFLCPFREERTPSLGVTPRNGLWKCFGCGLSGNVLDWVIRRNGLGAHDVVGAARILGALDPEEVRASSPVETAALSAGCGEPPDEVWQLRGWEYTDYTKRCLWGTEGEAALEYLRWRGLTDETIRTFGLGFNPRALYDEGGRWGLEGGRKVLLGMGITIPCSTDGALWYIQTRRPALKKDGSWDMLAVHLGRVAGYLPDRKYWAVKGGNLGGLFGVDEVDEGLDVLFLDEGEFNGMVAWQEAGDFIGVVSCGSASLRPESLWPWRELFLMARTVLVRFDADKIERADAFGEALSRRCRRVQVPGGGDTNGYHQQAGVRDWIQWELARLGR